MPAKRRAAHPEVIVAGSVYWDLIFFNLNEPPTLGEAVRTDRFTMTPGGGGYITAERAGRLLRRPGRPGFLGPGQSAHMVLDAQQPPPFNCCWGERAPCP